MESVSLQAPASLTPHKSGDWVGQTVAKRKNENGGNVKKKVRFDVPVTFPLSCPSSSMSPIEAIPGTSEDPFPNAVFSFDPPVEPLQSQVSGELDIEPKNSKGQSDGWMGGGGAEQESSVESVDLLAVGEPFGGEMHQDEVVQEEESGEKQQTIETAQVGWENVLQVEMEQPLDSNTVEGLDKSRKNDVQARGIFGNPARVSAAVTTPARSIFGDWPASQLPKPFGVVATPSSHAVGIFGNPAAKSVEVSRTTAGFGAMSVSFNFGVVQPATPNALFGGGQPVGSLEELEKEHQDPNPPVASSIPDPDQVGESDNDMLVIDHFEEEEEGEIVESTKNLVSNEPMNTSAGEGQAGVWKFFERCKKISRRGFKKISSGQKIPGPRCQVMCPNVNPMWTARRCKAKPTLNNLGFHIRKVHHHLNGCIDKLRCPDCDEEVLAELLQHHIQQRHKRCNVKCMTGVQIKSKTDEKTPSKNPSRHSSSIPQNLPEASTARAQLHGRVTDRKMPSSRNMIWVRNDIFRPEVYDFKSYLQRK